MSKEIGAYLAKTHLPELLRKAQAGQRFVITQRGNPVAELIPARLGAEQNTREAAQMMKAFMQAQSPVQADIAALFNEGRD
jgi:prevent-host-death family protein